MKQYALLAFLSPVASLLAVQVRHKAKSSKPKQILKSSQTSFLSMQMIWDMVTSNAMEPKTYKLPM